MTKETFIKAWAREMLSDNLDVMSEAEEFLFDFYNKVIAFETDTQQPSDSAGEEQLEPEGEVNVFTEPLDRFCPHLTPKAMMYWKEGAEFMRNRIKKLTPQQPSEGEIDALVTKLRADKTLGINEDKKKIIKAAIKQLLNR